MNIAGVTLSKTAAEKLAAAAIQTSNDLGYCDEVITVLRELGLPIPESKPVKVLLEVEVADLPYGTTAADLDYFHFEVSITGYEFPQAYVNDVGVKQ